MNLKAEKALVDEAICKTEGVFNKKTVKAAVKKFTDFAESVERQISDLEQTASSQSAQITQLSEAGEKAAQKLNEAQAKIAYQETKLADQKTKLDASEQVINQKDKIIKHIKTRHKKPAVKLENGNTLDREVKWNGTELEIEKTPQGRKVGYKVIQPDGSERSGVVNEFTQQRVATKTNINGENTYLYDSVGNTEKIVKGEVEVPTVIDRTVATINGRKVLTEKMSDGTTVVTEKYKHTDGGYGLNIRKSDANNLYIETYSEGPLPKYSAGGTYKTTYKYNEGLVSSKNEEIIFKDGKISKLNSNISVDSSGMQYVSEGVLEHDFAKLTGKVSKIDNIGEAKELTFSAECNPKYSCNGLSCTSIDGICDYSPVGMYYRVNPKSINIKTSDGQFYHAELSVTGSISKLVNARGEVIQPDYKLSGIEMLVRNLKLSELVKIN